MLTLAQGQKTFPRSVAFLALGRDVLAGRLAKLIAFECFRNTELENLHAGKFPSSKTGDYSDVKVVSPYGEIGVGLG